MQYPVLDDKQNSMAQAEMLSQEAQSPPPFYFGQEAGFRGSDKAVRSADQFRFAMRWRFDMQPMLHPALLAIRKSSPDYSLP
jgi:hypothetical protein